MAAFLKILQALKYIKQFGDWYKSVILKKKTTDQVEKIANANKKIDEAKGLEDDLTRLKEKANAVKAIEDSLSGRN
jgi:hypothetical protein